MSFMKVVSLSIACLASYIMMASSECTVLPGAENFVAEKFAGPWAAVYLPPWVLGMFADWHVNFHYAENGDSTITGKALKVNSDKSTSPFDVSGDWLIYPGTPTWGIGYKQDGASNYNANYTIISVDYECYALLQGCPDGAPAPLTAVLYRDPIPSEECYKEGLEELKKRGLCESVEEDKSIRGSK